MQKTIVVPGPDGKPVQKVVTEFQRVNQVKQVLRREDFCLIVKPYNDDAQSVSMEYSNDRGTEVSDDANKLSDVELNVISSGDKLYYYYTLNGMKYPEGPKIFTPHDGKAVYFLIFSSKRYDEAKDNVSVNLTINNKSSYPLDLKISNEDKNNPRIRVVKKVGNINILN